MRRNNAASLEQIILRVKSGSLERKREKGTKGMEFKN